MKFSKIRASLFAILLLAVIMCCGISAQAKYADVLPEDGAVYKAASILPKVGIMNPTSSTLFSPDVYITRQNMAEYIYRLLNAGTIAQGAENTTGFTDLDNSSQSAMIAWNVEHGIMSGVDETTFDPRGKVTLQDAYVCLLRALEYKNDLHYPEGYVEFAESIGLGKDIPASLDADDQLTRGNVAVLLLNASTTEMNEKTVTEWQWISNQWDSDNDGVYDEISWELVEVQRPYVVLNHTFGIVEETLRVTATNSYSLNGRYVHNDDIEVIAGVRYDSNGFQVGGYFEYEFSKLGLDGHADDYFLADITLFVKKDADDAAKDIIFSAASNLVKKTVKAQDVIIHRSDRPEAEYYVGGVINPFADKVMTGRITFGGIDAYLDAEAAPYEYKILGERGYNKSSVRFINIGGVYVEDGAPKFEFVDCGINFDGMAEFFGYNGAYDTLNNAFMQVFPMVYYNGLYEADVYDVNGDGYAEYVFVKPYSFVKMFHKDKKNFAITTDISCNDKNIVASTKYEDAVIVGEWNNGDTALVYRLSDNSYVEIKETVEPFESVVTSVTQNVRGFSVCTFENGKVADFTYADKKISTALPYPLEAGSNVRMYLKDSIPLYADYLNTAEFDPDANYAIVLAYDENAANVNYWDFSFNNYSKKNFQVVFTATGVSDGAIVNHNYVNVLTADGTVKAVKLADTAYTFVDYKPEDNKFYYNYAADSFLKKIHSETITDKVVAETVMTEDFYGKFSTYTINEDGSYAFKASEIGGVIADLNNTVIESSVFLATPNAVVPNATIEHYASSIYDLKLDGIFTRKVAMQDYSKVIIKTYDDNDDVVYLSFNKDNINQLASESVNLADVKAIIINNTKGSVENIGIIYAELIGELPGAGMPAESYTVMYDPAGGTGAPDVQIKAHGDIGFTLSETVPQKDGCIFMGWSTVMGGDPEYMPGAKYFINGNLSLFAVWKEIPVWQDGYAIVLAYDENASTERFMYDEYGYGGNYWVKTQGDMQMVYSGQGVVNGQPVTWNYAKLLVDGEIKTVKLAEYAYSDICAEFLGSDPAGISYYDIASLEELHEQDISDKVIAETVLYKDYYNKFAQYAVMSDGSYVLKPVEISDDSNILKTDKAGNAYLSTSKTQGANATIRYIDGRNYELMGVVNGNVNFTEDSMITLKISDGTYSVYRGAEFPMIDTSALNDVRIVLENNPEGNVENLVVMYAELVGGLNLPQYTLGDINNDGEVNRNDLLVLAKHFSGWDVDINVPAADVNGDGELTRRDLLRLAKFFAGWVAQLG